MAYKKFFKTVLLIVLSVCLCMGLKSLLFDFGVSLDDIGSGILMGVIVTVLSLTFNI